MSITACRCDRLRELLAERKELHELCRQIQFAKAIADGKKLEELQRRVAAIVLAPLSLSASEAPGWPSVAQVLFELISSPRSVLDGLVVQSTMVSTRDWQPALIQRMRFLTDPAILLEAD
jgi:hypothetical protein